jgi:autotransporter adhesin
MTTANRTAQHSNKTLFVRSVLAVALAQALMIGSAMAVGTDAKNTLVAEQYDVATSEETNDTDRSEGSSSTNTQLSAMGATPRSVGLMDVTDPQFAVEGARGNNNASLNGADPTTATALAMGVSSNANGGNTVALGLSAIANSDNSVALGSNVTTGADMPYSVAVGSDANTTGAQAVALGAHVQANADRALAVGSNNTWALGQSSIAMGDSAKVLGGATSSVAIGTNASVARNVSNAIALGANTNVAANANGGVALGAGARVLSGAFGSTALGFNAIADRTNVLSIGSAGAERQIINVAAGTQLTDAVNVSQLKGVTDAFGGGAGVGPDGSITQPSFTVLGHQYSTVEQAIQAAAAGGSTDPNAVRYDLNDDGSVNYGSVTLGGPAAAPVVLTNVADGKNQYDAVNFGQLSALQGQVDNLHQTVTNIGDRVTNIENGGGDNNGGGNWNYDAQGNKITNVGDGAVNAGSKDAVNGSQLAATAQSTADALGGGATLNADGTISTPTYTIGGQQVRGVEGAVNQLDRRIDGLQGQVDGLQRQLDNTARGAYSGIAAATALTMIPGVDVGKTLSVGAGVANYKGYTAAALGGEARVSDNWKVRAGVGLSASGNTVGVGASFQW